MKERPILFSAPMVRAILDGRKTQTRRTVKPQPDGRHCRVDFEHGFLKESSMLGGCWSVSRKQLCPYGKPGDRLWVRETWKYLDWTEDGCPYIAYKADGTDTLRPVNDERWIERVEDVWADLSSSENYSVDNCASDRRWRPSIHMPRWASRITIEITGIRVERLHAIRAEDALAEGVEWDGMYEHPRDNFISLWESINGHGSWDANPWVWVVEFKRV